MALNKSLMSSKRDSWNTPKAVLDLVRKALGEVDLDPCSNAESIVHARVEWSSERGQDGFEEGIWRDYGLVFVNPPYGRDIKDWVLACQIEGREGAEIVALLPARTDAAWFSHAWTASALCFWRGRLRFLGAPSSAPFPSVVAYWGPRRYRFADVFSEVGRVVFP